MEGKIVEDLTCRYIINADKLVTFCKSQTHYVIDEYHIDINQWGIPIVTTEEPDLKFEGVASGPFKGVLQRYRVDNLTVIEAEFDGRKIIRIEGPGGVVVERVRHYKALTAASIAKRLYLHLSVPAERAIEVATQIVCKEDGECSRNAREWLTLISSMMPEPPITLRYSKDVEYDGREVDGMFKVWRLRDPDFSDIRLITLPATCRRYFIRLKDGDTAWGLMCTANGYARNADGPVIARAGDVYLVAEPLYITAYIEKDELRCMDVGSECITVIKTNTKERGLVAEEFVGPWQIQVIETNAYKAYYVEDFKLLYVDVSGRAIKLKVPSGLSAVKDFVASTARELDEKSKKALINALKHVVGYAPWYLDLD